MNLRRATVLTVLAASAAGLFSIATGCELIAVPDRSQIGNTVGAGGAGVGGQGGEPTTTTGGGMGGTSAGGAGGQGTGGAGGQGGGTGGAGGGPECTVPGDCPATGTLCLIATCINMACGTMDAPPDTPCNDGGGSFCDGAGACVECNTTPQCQGNNVCINHVCAPPSCMDMVQNGQETDVDCGGSMCPPCAIGDTCAVGADCTSMFCNPVLLTCATPSCMDGFFNGNETDVDCGGATCPDCMNGQDCAVNGDCVSGFCNPNTLACAAPTCMDGFQNQDETDVDCGGATCPDCANGDSCAMDGDCTSTFCNPILLTCATPTCIDGFQNQDETGVDCGGATCPACIGAACTTNAQCASGMCYNSLCVADVNGCNINTATVIGGATTTVTFANGNQTYLPKCIRVNLNTVVTFSATGAGSFMNHPLLGGLVVGGIPTPATTGPFMTLTNTGTTKDFTMDAAGTFPYYCTVHAAAGMTGAVFVNP